MLFAKSYDIEWFCVIFVVTIGFSLFTYLAWFSFYNPLADGVPKQNMCGPLNRISLRPLSLGLFVPFS